MPSLSKSAGKKKKTKTLKWWFQHETVGLNVMRDPYKPSVSSLQSKQPVGTCPMFAYLEWKAIVQQHAVTALETFFFFLGNYKNVFWGDGLLAMPQNLTSLVPFVARNSPLSLLCQYLVCKLSTCFGCTLVSCFLFTTLGNFAICGVLIWVIETVGSKTLLDDARICHSQMSSWVFRAVLRDVLRWFRACPRWLLSWHLCWLQL